MESIKNLREVSIIKGLFLAILGTIILALSAKVKIPFWPVPMTMQTFVVLLLGIVYGWKLGLFTVSLYLLEGIAGLPGIPIGSADSGLGDSSSRSSDDAKSDSSMPGSNRLDRDSIRIKNKRDQSLALAGSNPSDI